MLTAGLTIYSQPRRDHPGRVEAYWTDGRVAPAVFCAALAAIQPSDWPLTRADAVRERFVAFLPNGAMVDADEEDPSGRVITALEV